MATHVGRSVLSLILTLGCTLLGSVSSTRGQESPQQTQPLGIGNWFTFSSNLDGGYRRTQFYVPHYDTGLFQWDSRLEFWLPPFRDKFSWGPYMHVAGI